MVPHPVRTSRPPLVHPAAVAGDDGRLAHAGGGFGPSRSSSITIVRGSGTRTGRCPASAWWRARWSRHPNRSQWRRPTPRRSRRLVESITGRCSGPSRGTRSTSFRHRAAAAAGQPGVVRWAGDPDGDRDHGMARRSAIGAGHLRIRQQYFWLLHDFGEAWRGPDCPPVDPGLAQSPVRAPLPLADGPRSERPLGPLLARD
jgi:hypothetical protein